MKREKSMIPRRAWPALLVAALTALFLSGCTSAPPGTLFNPKCQNAVWKPTPGYKPPSVCENSSCPWICESHRQALFMSVKDLKSAINAEGTEQAPDADQPEDDTEDNLDD